MSTEVTSINHVRYQGLPPFLAARNSFQPTVNYYKQLREAIKISMASSSSSSSSSSNPFTNKSFGSSKK